MPPRTTIGRVPSSPRPYRPVLRVAGTHLHWKTTYRRLPQPDDDEEYKEISLDVTDSDSSGNDLDNSEPSSKRLNTPPPRGRPASPDDELTPRRRAKRKYYRVHHERLKGEARERMQVLRANSVRDRTPKSPTMQGRIRASHRAASHRSYHKDIDASRLKNRIRMRAYRQKKKDEAEMLEEDLTEDEGIPAPPNPMPRPKPKRRVILLSEGSSEHEEATPASNGPPENADTGEVDMNVPAGEGPHENSGEVNVNAPASEGPPEDSGEDSVEDSVEVDAISRAFDNMCSPSKRKTRLKAIAGDLDLPVISPMTIRITMDLDVGPINLSPASNYRAEDHVLGDPDGISEGTFTGWEMWTQARNATALIRSPITSSPHYASRFGDDNSDLRDMSISPISSPLRQYIHKTFPEIPGGVQ